jgi:hypothetical protein
MTHQCASRRPLAGFRHRDDYYLDALRIALCVATGKALNATDENTILSASDSLSFFVRFVVILGTNEYACSKDVNLSFSYFERKDLALTLSPSMNQAKRTALLSGDLISAPDALSNSERVNRPLMIE